MSKGLRRRGGGNLRSPFERKHLTTDHGRDTVCAVTCKYCGREDHIHAGGGRVGGKHLPPDMIAKKFQQRGWQVNVHSKAPRCPDCVKSGVSRMGTINVSKILRAEILNLIGHHPDGISTTTLNQFMGRPDTPKVRDTLRIILKKMLAAGILAREGRRGHYSYSLLGDETSAQVEPVREPVDVDGTPRDETQTDQPEEEEVMETPGNNGQPSQAGAKAQRVMMQLLDAHFDEEAGHYAPGWSDAKVAQEVELSEDFVVRFREDAYGALKEPEEFAELRGEINALQEMCLTECKRLQERLSEVRRKYK